MTTAPGKGRLRAISVDEAVYWDGDTVVTPKGRLTPEPVRNLLPPRAILLASTSLISPHALLAA